MVAPTRKEIDRLTVAERIQLVQDIWDSIAEHPDECPLTDAQRDELDRRLAAHEADADAGTAWPVVRALLEGQCV
ncbi:MAG: addiction module protein [Planctomycetota bacterium]